MGDLDPPGVPDGAEDRLLAVPADPAQLQVVVPAELPDRGRGDSEVYQDEFEPHSERLMVAGRCRHWHPVWET